MSRGEISETSRPEWPCLRKRMGSSSSVAGQGSTIISYLTVVDGDLLALARTSGEPLFDENSLLRKGPLSRAPKTGTPFCIRQVTWHRGSARS